MTTNSKHIGTSLNNFLEETNDSTSVNIAAIKRIIAWQLSEKIQNNKISEAEIIKELEIDQSDLNGLLDPTNESLTIEVLDKAARAIGKTLRVKLV